MIGRLGMPAHSSSTASRKLRALQEPQPPKPVIATVASEVSRAQSAGSGGTETPGLSTRTAPLTSSSAADRQPKKGEAYLDRQSLALVDEALSTAIWRRLRPHLPDPLDGRTPVGLHGDGRWAFANPAEARAAGDPRWPHDPTQVVVNFGSEACTEANGATEIWP